jgi:hypothetical protein
MKYLVEFKSFQLNEGGNAFEDTQNIQQAEVPAAFAKFEAAMADVFGEAELELIGSWRQKPISGDLDTLFYSDLSLPDISKKLEAAGYQTQIFYGFNIVSVRFEIEPNRFAQFDMFVREKSTDRAMITLFYKSPNDEAYSTKHRVFLIFSALDSMKFDKEEQDGKLVKFKGYMLRPDGLYEFTKQLKKTNFSIVDRRKVTDDLDRISEILFGKVYPYAEWNTFLKTLSLLKQNSSIDIKSVLAEYRQKLENEGLRLPAEI